MSSKCSGWNGLWSVPFCYTPSLSGHDSRVSSLSRTFLYACAATTIRRGPGFCRMHRIVDASIFYLSAKEAAVKYAGSGLGLASLISMTSKWASVIQLLAMASTLLAPKFTAEKHEAFKASFMLRCLSVLCTFISCVCVAPCCPGGLELLSDSCMTQTAV